MTVETKTVLDGLEPVNLQHSLSFREASLEPDKPRRESRCIVTASLRHVGTCEYPHASSLVSKTG